MFNYNETTEFCSRIPGGHLAIVYDKDENDRIQQHALVRWCLIPEAMVAVLYCRSAGYVFTLYVSEGSLFYETEHKFSRAERPAVGSPRVLGRSTQKLTIFKDLGAK